ncbi:MAG: SpoIIE family protein phosphatase [Proteobacteria bacterium]|nr:SpoIIE family protein phosphatase [Pseudomonadota bacterium]MBU1611701.1 SpoIIE family protein phosphatase [Pseudomonadota bacterium]
MYISIKTKFSVLTALSLLLLAGGVALYTSRNVEQNMVVMQEQAAVNALNLSTMNVNDQYRSLVRWRVGEVLAVKQFLADFAATMGVVEEQVHASGSALSSPEAILEAFHLPQNVGFLAFDQDLNVVFTRGNVPSKIKLASARDIKGRAVASTMQREAQAGRTANCVVQETGGTEYYGAHVWLPTWKWTVGLWIDLNALKLKEAELTRSMIQDLNKSVGEVSIGSSGYLFIFTGKNGVIIPGPGQTVTTLDIKDALTGEDILEKLRQGAATPGVPIRAVVREQGKNRTWQARVSRVKALDWYIVSVAYLDEVKTPGRNLSIQLAIGIGITALVILAASLWLSSRMTAPLMQLARYARKVPDQDFMEAAEADPTLRDLAKTRNDEVGGLAQSLVFMDRALRERVQELLTATAARERIESELAVAHEIQMGMLPRAFKQTENPPPAFALQAFLEPAKEIGGDLYDFFMLDEDHLCFAVGDVSGKGIPAALFMSATLSLLRAGAQLKRPPEKLMESMNDALSKDNPRCMFVTLLFGILNIRTGEIAFANGGHNPPVILSASGDCAFLTGISGPLVGSMGDLPYEGLFTTLKPGDALFAYSDGVTEAMDKDMALFSDELLLQTLQQGGTTAPGEVLALVRDAVAEHVKGHPASDDITMLCLRYEGTPKNNG